MVISASQSQDSSTKLDCDESNVLNVLPNLHISPRYGVSPAEFDPETHYGAGDDNALYNLLATWPDSFFSSLPKPNGKHGIDEPC